MKNILLPTDLSVQSLWPIKKIADSYKGLPALTIHVIHMVEMPTSISDLLLLGRTKRSRPLPTSFKDALQILQSRYKHQVVKIKFDFVYGNSSQVLCNYMEAARIEKALILEGYKYQFSTVDAVNCVGFFKKAKVAVEYVSFKPALNSEFQVLSILLNDDKSADASSDFSLQPALAY